VGAVEQELDFGGVELAGKLLQIPLEGGDERRVRLLGFEGDQFEGFGEIADLAFRGQNRIGFAPDVVGFADQLLGLFVVIPEVVLGHRSLNFGEAGLFAWYVKETSANWRLWRRRRREIPSGLRT
jgi:hypothetical protein